MRNIKYMGKFTEESQIIRSELPLDAVKFKEPKSISKLILYGTFVSTPILILTTILFVLKQGNIFELSFFTFFISMALNFPLMFVHELVHALSFPKEVQTEIWTKFDEAALFVTFYEPITKIRFIMMSLAPAIILGFVPFTLYLMGWFDFNSTLSAIIGLTSWLMILSGVGDYLNVFNAVKQVPKNGFVFNHGIHSYWIT